MPPLHLTLAPSSSPFPQAVNIVSATTNAEITCELTSFDASQSDVGALRFLKANLWGVEKKHIPLFDWASFYLIISFLSAKFRSDFTYILTTADTSWVTRNWGLVFQPDGVEDGQPNSWTVPGVIKRPTYAWKRDAGVIVPFIAPCALARAVAISFILSDFIYAPLMILNI